MGIRISSNSRNHSGKTKGVLQEDTENNTGRASTSLKHVINIPGKTDVAYEAIDNDDSYDTTVANKRISSSINSSIEELSTQQQPEENTESTKYLQQYEGIYEDTQPEVKPFDRESTGTSGYSSYDYISSLNSYTGKRLHSEFRASVKKGLNEDDQRKILNKFRYIKGEIDAEILIDYFLQDDYFTNDDLEDISSSKPRHIQVVNILLKLLRLKPEAYQDFLKYLKEAGYEHVCDILEEPFYILALNHENITTTAAQVRLTSFRDEFIDQLEPGEVADIFLEYEEFSVDEYEEIMAENTRRAKSKCIHRLLMQPEHTHRGYLVLMQALKETDRLYLLDLFQQGHETNQLSAPREKCTVNVRSNKVVKKETKRTTKMLKESDQCQLLLKIQSDEEIKRLEVDITKEMNSCVMMISLNDELILDKECLITKVEQGSIIITLKGCGQYSLRRMFAKGVQGPLTDILRHIFLLPNIRKLIPKKGLEFELTLKCLPPEQHTERKSNSDLVITHMEFLLEELDALSFLTTLKEKATLTDEEIKTILSTKPMSRKTRTQAMLEKLLEKDAVDDFVDVLKKKKTYVWEHVFQAVDNRLLIPTNAVAKSYNELVDNMCPKLISEESCTTTFVLSDLDSSWSRERQARYVLQQVLKQDFDTKLHFVSILFLYDHIPPEITPKATKRMHKSAPRKAGKKTDQRPKIQPTEVFVGDFVVSTNERKGMKPVKAYCDNPLNPISITRSITRRLEKTARKDKAGQDTTFC